MVLSDPQFTLRLAQNEDDLLGAQRLRYRVFVQELGGDGPMVDHDRQLETDAFDPHCDHLLLIDNTLDPLIGNHVVGVYRLMSSDGADRAGGFYSETEYDLKPLKSSSRRLLELGRSCVVADHRGGKAMYHLWRGLADYIADNQIEILFGVASFHGTNVAQLAEPLAYLHENHLAPIDLRVQARLGNRQEMDLFDPGKIDKRRALRAIPPLIKAYLRLGGYVGEGAFIDRAFNTTDVCLIMDTTRMNEGQRGLYTKDRHP